MLTKWINDIYGYHPVIIGGWAVFSYAPSLGSRDIDIVFPTRESVGKVLLPYYTMRGYQEEGLFTKHFFLPIQTKTGLEKIILDACSLADKNRLHENKDIELPWELTQQYYQEWELEKNTKVQVPQIELLILYKIKALCDRRYDLEHLSPNPRDREYMNSKIWKDEHDIQVLTQHTFNKEVLQHIAKSVNFEKYYQREMKRLKLH